MKSFLATCAVAALCAGGAQAATATYATLTSTGDFGLSAGPSRSATLTGSATASIIGNPSVVRDYSLEYSITVSAFGHSRSLNGSRALGSFALTDAYPILAGAGSSGPLSFMGITGSYSNLTLGAPDSTVDYDLALNGHVTSWLFGELDVNLPSHIGAVTGDYTVSAAFVAPVPVPAALPLLLTGFAGFAGVAARKRRKRQAA